MTNKEKYKILCETEGSLIPLFLHYWWMEAVCQGKQWDVALAYAKGRNSNGNPSDIVGALPYHIGSKGCFRYVIQPQLTQFNGPWFREDYASLSQQKYVCDQLIDHLQGLRLAYFDQHFSPRITNWLPFYWRQFKQTTRYTYRIPDIRNLDAVFDAFDRDKRQKPIRKIQDQLKVEQSLSVAEFADFHHRYWASRGQKDLLSKDFICRICQTAIDHRQGAIFALRNEQHELQAARFVVWDQNGAYALLSALNPQGHDGGASPLLFWRIMQYLSQHVVDKDNPFAFDFEGSMDSGIEYSYRLYGAEQTPFFRITKSNNLLFAHLLKLKETLGR